MAVRRDQWEPRLRDRPRLQGATVKIRRLLECRADGPAGDRQSLQAHRSIVQGQHYSALKIEFRGR